MRRIRTMLLAILCFSGPQQKEGGRTLDRIWSHGR